MMFQPWIGSNWNNLNNILGIRLLVLGESHYCSPEKKEMLEKCEPSKTNDVVEEYLVYKNYKFFTNLTQVIYGQKKSQLSDSQLKEIWSSIAFYNYVPVFASVGARVKPTDAMFAAGQEPFAKICAEMRPEAILICGFRLNEVLWKDFATGPRENKGGSPFYDIHGIIATYIQHPSSGFNSTAWRPRVVELLGRAMERRRTNVSAATEWSEELKHQTRDILSSNGLDAPHGDLYMKHIDSHFGVIALDDLLNARLRIVDRRSGSTICFPSVDALIAGGWVVD